jgi:hypothetical protein
LLAPIKDRFTYQDFEKLTQLAQKVSGHESRSQSTKGMYHVWQMMDYLSHSDSDENEIDLAEWNKNTKIVGCSWVKKEARRERYDFDVIKAKKIFDLLLQEKHLSLLPNHMLPSPEELKKKKW